MNAASAISAYKANHGTAALAIADTVANILANISGLNTLQTAGEVASLTITGTANSITSYQASEIAPFTAVSIASGATLVVTDTAANLLSASRAAGVALATSVVLTGSNTVSAAQAASLAALHGFSLGAGGTTLVISDTGANLANAAYSAGIAAATSKVLTGDSVVNVAALNTLAHLGNLTESSTGVLHVEDSAANLLTLGTSTGLGLATYVLLTGSNTVTAAQATTLAGMTRFGSVAGATLTVSDSVANLLANTAAAAKYANTTVITGQNTITAAQMVQLATLYHVNLASGASLVVNDTYANIQAAEATIAGLNRPAGYGIPAATQFIESQAPVGATPALQVNSNVISFSVSDSSVHLGEGGLVELNGESKLTGITVTDTNPVALSYSDYANATQALSLITGGTYSLDVSGVPTSALSTVNNDPHVASFTVTDTISSALGVDAGLGSYANASGIVEEFDASSESYYPQFYYQGASGAAPVIINLSAGPNSPNAGPASYQAYATPNPLVYNLAAGTYQVSVVGATGGGLYNGFSINSANNSYSDGWHYSINGGANNSVVTGVNYATGALAAAAYESLSPTVLTLSSASTVDFYLNDAGAPYFADDSGGVSLSLVAVPAAPATSTTGESFLTLTDVPLASVGDLAQDGGIGAFTISDTAADFAGQTSTLALIPKLTGITVTGTSGGDTIDLTGVTLPATIELGGNDAHATSSLGSASLSFIGSVDAVTLGTGASTVDYTMNSGGGIETVAGFTYGTDTLNIDLQGATLSQLQFTDTKVNGQNAISIANINTNTVGAVLVGTSSGQTAADLLANHTAVINGHLFIN